MAFVGSNCAFSTSKFVTYFIKPVWTKHHFLSV